MPMIPAFRIVILDETDGTVAWSYGGGKLERDLVASVLAELDGKRLGMLTSRATIHAAVSDAIYAVCLRLKQQTAQVMEARYAKALEEQRLQDLQTASTPLAKP